MSHVKESLVSKLLAPGSSVTGSTGHQGAKPLIVDLDSTSDSTADTQDIQKKIDHQQSSTPVNSAQVGSKSVQILSAPTQEGPTMLEMMMEAQRAAKKEKEDRSRAELAKEPLAKGFKKGFFGVSKESKKNSRISKTMPDESSKSTAAKQEGGSEPVYVKPAAQKKKDSDAFVFDEVQKAMEENQHPILKQLKHSGRSLSPYSAHGSFKLLLRTLL